MEWLTTGQMIDRLKVGEVAKATYENKGSSLEFEIKREKRDLINISNSTGKVYFDNNFFKSKWRILPKFVNFEEAMKADKDEYKVFFHPNRKDGTKIRFNFGKIIYNEYDIHGYTMLELVEGKWTIEE